MNVAQIATGPSVKVEWKRKRKKETTWLAPDLPSTAIDLLIFHSFRNPDWLTNYTGFHQVPTQSARPIVAEWIKTLDRKLNSAAKAKHSKPGRGWSLQWTYWNSWNSWNSMESLHIRESNCKRCLCSRWDCGWWITSCLIQCSRSIFHMWWKSALSLHLNDSNKRPFVVELLGCRLPIFLETTLWARFTYCTWSWQHKMCIDEGVMLRTQSAWN